MTGEFGKGFDESNLRKMRQFYCCFPNRDTLCPELSWSHYRVLMRISDEKIRALGGQIAVVETEKEIQKFKLKVG